MPHLKSTQHSVHVNQVHVRDTVLLIHSSQDLAAYFHLIPAFFKPELLNQPKGTQKATFELPYFYNPCTEFPIVLILVRCLRTFFFTVSLLVILYTFIFAPVTYSFATFLLTCFLLSTLFGIFRHTLRHLCFRSDLDVFVSLAPLLHLFSMYKTNHFAIRNYGCWGHPFTS